jgi:hypothetical protein
MVAAATKDNGRNVLMETSIKQRIAAGALALTLLGGSGVGVAAQGNGNQVGGAAGLVAAVVQADDVLDIYVVDSLNNLTALNNILNNSPILSQNDIDVTLQNIDVNVLAIQVGDVTVEDVLNENEIEVEDVLAVAILENGSVLIFI